LIKGLLRSPLHRLASGYLALITVTGRRSGREYTFPVGYSERNGRVVIGVGWPERKSWLRNLREPAPFDSACAASIVRARGSRAG
jgi:hypothetical protein